MLDQIKAILNKYVIRLECDTSIDHVAHLVANIMMERLPQDGVIKTDITQLNSLAEINALCTENTVHESCTETPYRVEASRSPIPCSWIVGAVLQGPGQCLKSMHQSF
jgi:hypothetical protein